MNSGFKASYDQLNNAQRQAVDTTEGPLLIIAGPGTGKTQLLTTRAAKIISLGSAAASNILCLTYTEAGAAEMRARMTTIMGPAGSDVAVHTFHGLGTWMISQYPEYFSEVKLLKPLDDLGRYRIFETLLDSLPLRHPLAVRGENEQFIRRHAVEEAIRAFKQAGLTPDQLRVITKDNIKTFKKLQPLLDELFSTTLSAKRLPAILELVEQYIKKSIPHNLDWILLNSLLVAVLESETAGKTAPLGEWRGSYTVIKNGTRVLKSSAQSALLHDVIDLYEQYQHVLAAQGMFDYEDMVLWAALALETNTDLRLDIAERFQYIMVDEYQDTNGAQNRLLDALLQANPLNSPNIMAVGDDDQAIMRFQGAEVSGMLRFAEQYQPTVIVLKENYRSGQLILDASRQIMTQTDDRLEVALPALNLTKTLEAKSGVKRAIIQHRVYASPSVEYQAISEYITELLKQGTASQDIAVIGRKHAELSELIPFLTVKGISISYDRRENILEHENIRQLLQLARFIAMLAESPQRASLLIADVLAAPYWHVSPLETYQLAAEARANKLTWIDTMLSSSDPAWVARAEWLVAAAGVAHGTNFTRILDILIGRELLPDVSLFNSPFASYLQERLPEDYVMLLSNLICLRNAVLEARPNARGLNDLLEVTDDYRLSGLRLVDNNPVLRGDAEGVQVMTAHGSKGREFDHVIIVSAIDTIWGSKARGQTGRIRLPENLPLYPAGDSESDRLRLLYVAMTRAKSNILLTSYQSTDSGKLVAQLSYLQLGESDGWWNGIGQKLDKNAAQNILETAWRPTETVSTRSLQAVLDPLLKNYRLSASALRTFLDIRYGGPQACIEQSVLKFPSAYNARSALGSAAHRVLEIAFRAYQDKKPLADAAILEYFDKELSASGLSDAELRAVREHGHQFLPLFISRFTATDFEVLTATEQFVTAVLPTSKIPLSGAIDAIASTAGGVKVIDYKTGKPPLPQWRTTGLSDSKKTSLHFYRQQLLFYKLLVDNSNYGQAVTDAELIFVEPSDDAAEETQFVRLLIDNFDKDELARTEQLIQAVYQRIVAADLPDISSYSRDLKGILAFEADLLSD